MQTFPISLYFEKMTFHLLHLNREEAPGTKIENAHNSVHTTVYTHVCSVDKTFKELFW